MRGRRREGGRGGRGVKKGGKERGRERDRERKGVKVRGRK